MTRLNMLDTFSGMGAALLAAKRLGIHVVAHAEIDKHCNKLLKKHYPEIPSLGDVRNVTKETVTEPVDLLVGGTPCQDLSIAGKRQGLDGEKSQLWFEYLRVAQEFRPQWLVWENVPGALFSNGGRDFLTILRGMDECGYHVAWRMLDAQYYGVPQRRRRIFLVASLGDGRAAQVLFERESLPGTSKSRPEKWEAAAVAGTITASASGTARTGGNANQIDLLVFEKQKSDSFRQGSAVSVDATLTARDKKDYGDLVSFNLNPVTGKMEAEKVLSFSPSKYKRGFGTELQAKSIANTLQANKGSGFSDTDETIIQHGMIRRLTPLECERLQGFPDNFTEGFSDSIRYTLTGNSIAVPVITWVLGRIQAVQS